METKIEARGFDLSADERGRIERQLAVLEKRLASRPSPIVSLTFSSQEGPRRISLDAEVKLSPLGGHLVSHQGAGTPEQAARLAISDIERELERRVASQRNEASYGVPSRRSTIHRTPRHD